MINEGDLPPTPKQLHDYMQGPVPQELKNIMQMRWWDQLSDGELRRRLLQRNIAEDEVDEAVLKRDKDPRIRWYLQAIFD